MCEGRKEGVGVCVRGRRGGGVCEGRKEGVGVCVRGRRGGGVCEGRKEGVGVCVREERRWCEGMMTCTFSLSALFSASLPCHSAV